MTTVPLDQIEALFGITFTDHERMLLTTSKALLSTREQQASYILAMGLQTCQCPACPYLLCQRSASIEPFDPASSTPDDAYACPNCKAALTWHLGMIGGGQWFTLTYPGQVADAAALADAADLCSVEIDGRPWADGNGSTEFPRSRAELLASRLGGRVIPAGRFTAGQPVTFRDRTRSAEPRPGTFARYAETEHRSWGDVPLAVVTAEDGHEVRTEVSRIELRADDGGGAR